MGYLWAIDHDGTASKGDIGKDYLCRECGLTPESFFEEVDRIRGDPEYREAICREIDSKHENGLELAMLLALNSVPKEAVEKSGLDSYNSMRDGFEEGFVLTPDRKVIISAGPRDWLKGRYQNMETNNLEVLGTELYAGPDGKYSSIKIPCGRDSKYGVIKSAANSDKAIVVGDSTGDDMMWLYARLNNGLAICVGDNAGKLGNTDIGVHNGSWYPVWAIGEMWAAEMGYKDSPNIPDAFGQFDMETIEATSQLGKDMLNRLQRHMKKSRTVKTGTVA